MVKHTQTIRWQIADELFECVWPFCEISAKRVKDVASSFHNFFTFSQNNHSITQFELLKNLDLIRRIQDFPSLR